MPDPAHAILIPVGRLRLSKSPTAELAGAAVLAQQEAGLDEAAFIVVAVPPDAGAATLRAVEAAARAAPASAGLDA